MNVKVWVFVFCALFILHCIDGRGGGRGSSSRGGSRSHSTSHSSHSSSSGGGFFSRLFGGGTKSTGTSSSSSVSHKSSAPHASSSPSFNHKSHGFPTTQSHVGFSAYGRNYQSNFHNSGPYHHQPISHPQQAYFQPHSTSVFAYHFMPFTTTHHYYHHSPNYYDYRNSSSSTAVVSKEPVMYDYKPPISNDSSSEEKPSEPLNPNDFFIAGVENMLFYGGMKDDQHQVVLIVQGSDGITLEEELLSIREDAETMGELQYFPEVEFRFDADDDPNDNDIENIRQMYSRLVDNGRC